jgi:hypothetical protein
MATEKGEGSCIVHNELYVYDDKFTFSLPSYTTVMDVLYLHFVTLHTDFMTLKNFCLLRHKTLFLV